MASENTETQVPCESEEVKTTDTDVPAQEKMDDDAVAEVVAETTEKKDSQVNDEPSKEAAEPAETTEKEDEPSEEAAKTAEPAENGTGDKEQNGSATVADPALKANILKQIEYYFGDYNLPRDRFLTAEVKKDDGWIALDTMMKFSRLARLTKDASIVAQTIKEAENSIMEVHSEMKKIRRSPKHPLPDFTEDIRDEAVKRTVYCKGFPKDGSVTLDDLFEFFKQFGDYDSVRMRNFIDKNKQVSGFKGSVLVVFKTVELAKAFMEAPPMQYKKIYLIRKWFADYMEEKKQEFEERKAKKQAKLENSENSSNKEFAELGRGLFLKATGFKDNTSREEIKASVFDLTQDCAFVDFRKGDKEAYIRFNEAGSNKQMFAALKGNLKVNDVEIELFMVEGEEEDAQLQKANDARRRAHSSGGHQNHGKKRRMGGGGFRGRNKRHRSN